MIFTLFLVFPVWAGDDPPAVETPTPPAATPDADARIAALEAQVQALQADLLQTQAEVLAGPDLSGAPQVSAPSAYPMNPGLTAFGDLVGQLGVQDGAVLPGSTMYLRSVELDIRAAVDPYAKAAVVIAFEQEAPALDGTPGEGFGAEPEEAYLDLVALPWRLSGRVGKFKMPFGIVNRTHPHDLPWVEAPPGLEALGEEGYNDTGGTLSWILPAGPVGLTFTGGVMSGEPWEEAGGLASPAALGRAEAFASFGHLDLSLGASAIEHPGLDAHALGADLSLRVRPNTYRSFVLLAELVQGTEGGLGGYAAVQVQPSRSLYLGLREDWVDDALQHNAYLSYYTSEFLRMRVGASYAPADDLLVAQLQTTFVWGSHPTEPWWVNR